MDNIRSRYLWPKLVVTCAVLTLISATAVLTFRSGLSPRAFPVRFPDDLEWVDVCLRCDMLAALSGRSELDRHSWETLLGRTPRLTEAWDKLHQANQHWEGRRQREAKAAWQGIAHLYPETDAAFAALTNLANVLQAQHQISDAGDAYRKILDLEPPVLQETDMIYDNYRHRACCELSKIHEQNGDLELAEKYARQAAVKDTFHDECGMFVGSVQSELDERVKSLQTRISN